MHKFIRQLILALVGDFYTLSLDSFSFVRHFIRNDFVNIIEYEVHKHVVNETIQIHLAIETERVAPTSIINLSNITVFGEETVKNT